MWYRHACMKRSLMKGQSQMFIERRNEILKYGGKEADIWKY